MDGKVVVSVCVFTYNYEKYLKQALDSIILQKTNFRVEIIIGDDCSTDSTREIAKKYFAEYPERIVLSFNERNIGGTKNWISTIGKSTGRYIALLDGDDYFSDAHKLQKQVDLMESDAKSVLSFHAIEEKFDDITGEDRIVRFEKPIYNLEDFLSRGWFIRTGSTMFKNGLMPNPIPEWVFDFPYRFDTILHVFLALKGHALYIDEVMSVWRKHQKGVSRQLMADGVKNILAEISLAKRLNKFTNGKEERAVKEFCSRQYSSLLFYLFRNRLWKKHIRLLPTILLNSDWKEIAKRLNTRTKNG